MKTEKTARIIVDLGFGDSGKGTLVDALAHRTDARLVVRYNGGAQAGHNVHPIGIFQGRQHTFSQWGSGSFVSGVRTFLSQHMVVHPITMIVEAGKLMEKGITDPWRLLIVDERCLVATPFHQAVNRIRELIRGEGRHGSCGLGIGETVGDAYWWGSSTVLRFHHLTVRDTLKRMLREIHDNKHALVKGLLADQKDAAIASAIMDEMRCFQNPAVFDNIVEDFLEVARKVQICREPDVAKLINSSHDVIFEGAHGVLLDEWKGFHPYTTWSTNTARNAISILENAGFSGNRQVIGVLRGYHTRHGRGPFPTYDEYMSQLLADQNNPHNPWQETLKSGWFDAVLARYSISVCNDQLNGPIDMLAITNLDRMKPLPNWHIATGYEYAAGATKKQIFRLDYREPRFGDPNPLAHQERLTALLETISSNFVKTVLTARPEMGFGEKVNAHLAMIEALCQLPVKIRSFGPTAEEKQFDIGVL
jgi:adenylosuccinate synthase